MSRRIADVVIETLYAAGVERCYGIVGDTLNLIAHAIDRSGIRWVHVRHEEAGAFAASAEALLTGRLIPKVMTADRREPTRAFRGMCFCLALR